MMNLQKSRPDPVVVQRLAEDSYKLIEGHNRIGCFPGLMVRCIIIGELGRHMIPKTQIRREL